MSQVVVRRTLDPEWEQAPGDAALLKAQLAYLIDHQGRPPEYYYALVQDHMSLPVFLSHVHAQQWIRTRDRIQASAQQLLLRRLRDRVVSDRMHELSRMKNLLDKMMEYAMPDESSGQIVWNVEPKSLEGLVRAMKDLFGTMDNLRDKLNAEVQAATPEVDTKAEIQGPLPYETAVEVTKQVLRKQIESQRQQLSVTAGEDEAKEGK